MTSEPGEPLSLRGAQAAVDEWIRTIGVRYFGELTNLAQLVEEVGELARVLSRTYGEQSAKEGEQIGDASDEMADVLFVLICLANQTGVDLETALRKSLEKKTRRDARRHRANPKLSAGGDTASGPAGGEPCRSPASRPEAGCQSRGTGNT